jgi:biotin carboxyl carrier protein
VRFDAAVLGRQVPVEVRGQDGRYQVTVDGRAFEVDYQETGSCFVSLLIEGRSYEAGLQRRAGGYDVVLADDVLEIELKDAARGEGAAPRASAVGPVRVGAPMPGKVVRVLVEPGQEVRAGQGLVVVEAMKMENELRAPRAGRVAEVHALEGRAVETGALLAVVE